VLGARRLLPRWRGLRGLGLALGALLERVTKLTDALAQGTGERRQAFWPEDDQRDQGDEQQVDGVLDAHGTPG
jgi:hypothetical protein